MNTDMLCMGCMEEKGGEKICPFCGYDESAPVNPLILPPRTRLMYGQYLVGRILGKPGGFGITYLGWDVKLETKVAIKEFFPRELVGRANHATVVPYHKDDKELFNYGLERFLWEARTLAKFSHPNVVRIRTFFEENSTAYLVMDYYEGLSLGQYLKDKGGKVDETLALEIMLPIMDGLREVHEKGFLHRDIKPQNIYLTEEGTPILLDFGSARFAVGEKSRSISVVLSPGYSPYEQYHKKGKQGVWSDVYSVAATLYRMLTGKPPLDSADRIMDDDLEPVITLSPGVSPQLNDAVMQALAVKAENRPQSIKAFQDIIVKDREYRFESGNLRTAVDDALFQFSKKLGKQALELYLVQFPQGHHAAEVQNLLAEFPGEYSAEPTGEHIAEPREAESRVEPGQEEIPPEDRSAEFGVPGEVAPLEETGADIEASELLELFEPVEPGRKAVEEELLIEYQQGFEYKTKSGLIVSTGALKRQGKEGVLVWEDDEYVPKIFPGVYRNDKGFWEINLYGRFPFPLVMVYVPAGEFAMGNDEGEAEQDEMPVHSVFLHGYWISKFEVTFKQFDLFCKETGLYINQNAVTDKKRPADAGWGRSDRPVINVSWNDAVEFCKWMSGRSRLQFWLPSEAQWEKAARGTDMRIYPWGDKPPKTDLVNFKESHIEKTAPVNQFPGGSSPYGVMNMSGNVWEWCRDWYGEEYYKISPAQDPEGPANGMTRVKRGGSWDSNEWGIRCSYRNSSYGAYRDYNLGFRLMMAAGK